MSESEPDMRKVIHITTTATLVIETEDGPVKYVIPFNGKANFVWSNPTGLKVSHVYVIEGYNQTEIPPEAQRLYETE